jgi:hypothetical protein
MSTEGLLDEYSPGELLAYFLTECHVGAEIERKVGSIPTLASMPKCLLARGIRSAEV